MKLAIDLPLKKILDNYQGRNREHHTGYTGEMAHRLRKLDEYAASAENTVNCDGERRKVLLADVVLRILDEG